MQAGALEYPYACYDELDIRTLRDDLDSVGNRIDYASNHTRNICSDMEEINEIRRSPILAGKKRILLKCKVAVVPT